MAARILVIDDERSIRELLEIGLGDEGYAVRAVPDGIIGLSVAKTWLPDAIVLDVMLPKLDGVALLPHFRRITEAPIVMLSAKSGTDDAVAGLQSGADDYVAKPFEMTELLARLETALRRPRLARPETLRFADLTIDLATRGVTRGERRIALSAREFDLLAALLREPNRVFTRNQLLDRVWGTERFVGPGAVETYISYLRAKVDAGERKLIHTHRGAGYSLRED